MATTMSSIRPLPVEAQLQLKSSVALNSVNDVIIGLLKNSLDAQAQTIQVGVDFLRGYCSVEDDGAGIPADEFGARGGLGLMHSMEQDGGHHIRLLMLCRHLQIRRYERDSWTTRTLPGVVGGIVPSFHILMLQIRAMGK